MTTSAAPDRFAHPADVCSCRRCEQARFDERADRVVGFGLGAAVVAAAVVFGPIPEVLRWALS